MENRQKILRVAVLGNLRSGKTSLIDAILGINFSQNYFATFNNKYTKSKDLLGNIPVEIIDTPALDQNRISQGLNYRFSLGLDYRDAQIFIICLDLNKPINLETTRDLVEAIKLITQPICPVILLVGTKADLIDESKKESNAQELEKKARNLGGFTCFITSANEKTNIQALRTKLSASIKELSNKNTAVAHFANDSINKQKPIQRSSSFWQRHKHKIINGIIISTFAIITMTLAFVLPVAPLLAGIGLVIPFTGLALTATLAGIGAAVGLVAGSVVAGIKTGVEALVKFFQHNEKKQGNVGDKDDQSNYSRNASGPLHSVPKPSNVSAAKNDDLPRNFSSPIGIGLSEKDKQAGSNTASRMNQPELSSSPS